MKRSRSPARGPEDIGDFVVFHYSPIDNRHRPTGKTRHYVGAKLETAIAGVAICRYPDDADFYLLYCDGDWKPITDTCHSTIEEAMHQAEFEFAGISKTWVSVNTKESAYQPPPAIRPPPTGR